MSALAAARLYLVAGERLAAGSLAELVPALAGAGVDMVQLRVKDREARDVLAAGEPIAAACRAAGLPFIVNDRPDVALALDAAGVHLGQGDVPSEVARRILGNRVIGRSTARDSAVRDISALVRYRRPRCDQLAGCGCRGGPASRRRTSHNRGPRSTRGRGRAARHPRLNAARVSVKWLPQLLTPCGSSGRAGLW